MASWPSPWASVWPAVGAGHGPERAAKPAARAVAVPGYVIGLADVLRVIVWKEPDLTLDVTVRPDGMITVPLLGDVQAAGRAPSQLAAQPGRRSSSGSSRALASPSASPRPPAPASTSSGQMVRPGEFPLSGRMTVLKALALAGGLQGVREVRRASSSSGRTRP